MKLIIYFVSLFVYVYSQGKIGYKTKFIKLIILILEPPKISKDFDRKFLAKDDPFSVLCSVLSGSQPLFFQWFKNGQLINKQSDENEIKLIDETQSMFKIKKVTSNDSGNYSCNVKNAFGEDNHTVKLIVKG